MEEQAESVADILSRIDEDCKNVIEKWTVEQQNLKSKLKTDNEEDFQESIKYIGGVDISFVNDKNDCIHASACLVILSYPELKLIYKDCQIVHLTSVYIPGFLAFRETEPLVSLCHKLKESQPEIYPQVILVDGNGVLHTHRFGLASHFGVLLDLPTIGVAKKLFQVDKLEKNEKFKCDVEENCKKKGDTLDLIGKSGFLYGKAFRSTDTTSNPIFISIGHKVNLQTCVDIVNICSNYRVPEPVRLADQYSREHIRTCMAQHIEECGDTYTEINKRFLMLTEKVKEIRGTLREERQ